MLDPRRLRLLIALESLGTVRAVAEAAAMSPSAVSQQLAALERESGSSLLVRHGRTVALTDAGVALAAHARAILERIGAAEEDLRALRDAPAGTVRIAAFTSAMHAFVIRAAADVGRTHPSIAVHLAELEPDDCLPALARGEVDLAVVADHGDGTFPHAPLLRSVPLAADELMAVLPPGRAFGGELAELRDDAWLLDGTELERHVLRRCRQAGFEPRVAGRLFSHAALLHAVRAGLGVTVLPSFALDEAAGLVVRPLTPVAVRELHVLLRDEALNRRSVALTLGVLTDAARSATREEEHQRDDREREDQRVDDHATGDGDDQQDDGENQEHGDPLPSRANFQARSDESVKGARRVDSPAWPHDAPPRPCPCSPTAPVSRTRTSPGTSTAGT